MLTRITTGLVLIAATVSAFGFLRIFELTLFLLFLFIAAAGAELLGMMWAEKASAERPAPVLRWYHWLVGASYAVPLLFELVPFVGSPVPFSFLSAVALWCAALSLLVAAILYKYQPCLERAVAMWMAYMAGFGYIALPGLVIFKLTALEAGSVVFAAPFWFAVAVVYMGDTGAYFTGVSFGKHKLIPAVSPKKTWEGSLGGLAWSAATAVVLNWYWDLALPLITAVVLGLLIGIAGQTGDLLESAIKRVAGCKDSGKVFPGHGGVLDRIDSLLFAAPVCYGFFVLFGLV
jgi:phosphatidate cytidylyltransferase